MKKYAGEEFLNRLYKDLIHSDEVKHTAKGGNKNEDLAIYLERLDRITKRVREHDRLDLLKKYYYDKYVIKEENIPESYFELQERILLESGFGHIEFNAKDKLEEANHIIKEQKDSLDNWLNYFISEETNHYPMWFKYYVFQNIVKIGEFDKNRKEFTRRTNSTIKPFLGLNKEGVALLYDELCKYLNKDKVDDENLENLIKNGSFFKIFGYITSKLDSIVKNRSNATDGIWKKYEKDSDFNILVEALEGKGTGWCTAGKETAKAQLEYGDFYVYFTKDNEGNYTIPRIAIRIEYDCIAEVRGVAEEQQIEPEFEDVVEEKLNEFPDKDEYKKKVKDMALLTIIYNKNKANEKLSIEELRFLYEIDQEIIGFGYKHDLRVREIINSRNIKKDLSLILGLKEYQISLTLEDVMKGYSKYHYGNLILNAEISKKVKLPEEVSGIYSVVNANNSNDFNFPLKAQRVVLPSLEYAKGVVFPENLQCLQLIKLKIAEGLVLQDSLQETYLPSLINLEGIVLPKNENGELYIPGKIYCPFPDIKIIAAAKRTEARQSEPKIFEEINDDLSVGVQKK